MATSRRHRHRVERLDHDSSRLVSRQPRSASPGRVNWCIPHTPGTPRCMSSMFQVATTPIPLAAVSSTFDEHLPHYSPDGTTAGIRVDPVGFGRDLDRQSGRLEPASTDVHGRTTVLQSPVGAGRADHSLQLAPRRFGGPLSDSAGHRHTHEIDQRSGRGGGSPVVARWPMDPFRVEQDRPAGDMAHAGGGRSSSSDHPAGRPLRHRIARRLPVLLEGCWSRRVRSGEFPSTAARKFALPTA